MKLIRRYLITQLSSATLFALIALLGLYAFFDVVKEVSSLGKGSYGFGSMLSYVALLMPGHAYELMPLAVLIGGMVAMTQLATHSEYTIIRTSGVSLAQIANTLVMFGLIFAVLTIVMGEFISPLAEQKAERMRLQATRSMVAQDFRSGIWVKDNNHLINVGELLPDNTLLSVRIYQYDDNYHLVKSQQAERGHYNGKGHWTLTNLKETTIEPDRTIAKVYPSYDWNSVIQPDILNVLLVVPEQMSALNLITYIHHLEANKQKTQRYDIALWSKLFYPLACLSMALIALAFTPQQRRHGQLGVRLFLGICLGIGFHFTNRLFGFLGLLYDWNPIMSATLPTLTFLLAGVALIAKQERR